MTSLHAGDYLKSDICKREEQEKFNTNKRRTINTVRSNLTTNYQSVSPTNSLAENNCNMGDEESMFSIGSIVMVETGYDHSFEGEVIAFDYKYKILLLKCTAMSGNTMRNDIHFVNLECAKNVKIKKEAKRKEQSNFPSIEIEKVEQRKNTAIDERNRLVKAFDAGIKEDGLKLYLHLSKTLKTTFEGKNIIVMNDVVISAPYKVENCTVISSSSEKKGESAVNYVKQLVEKFWSDQ